MKKHTHCTFIFFLISTITIAQGTWVQKNDFPMEGGGRGGAASFSIGSKAYVGLGADPSTIGSMNDFWEYDPIADSWTKKSDFAGGYGVIAADFSIGNKGYIIMQNSSDLWEYDPLNDSWGKKAPFPGLPRYGGSISFAIGTKGYFGLGQAGTLLNDFWEYNSNTDKWLQKTDFPYSCYGSGFSVINSGYCIVEKDNVMEAWQYDTTSNVWDRNNDFPGKGADISWLSIDTKVYLGLGTWDGGNIGELLNDYWEYNPINDTWCQKTNFAGGGRTGAIGFSIAGKGYVGLGNGGGSNLFPKDIWEFIPDTGCTTGITDDMFLQKISMYPNPMETYTTIILNQNHYNKISFAITDLLGRNQAGLITQEISYLQDEITIKINRNILPSGYYLYKVFDQAKLIATEKIIVN